MIVLDTNVVSELMAAEPEPAVTTWLLRQPLRELVTTSVTVGEVTFGLHAMPDGRRREAKLVAASQIWTAFERVILPFDRVAAERYGEVLARRRAIGRPTSTLDAQIAAICLVHGATLATRNVKDFDGTGVDVVDPWAV